jgi:hypothetical protein
VKGWSRAKKEELIRSKNPTWKDLSEGWPGLPEKKSVTMPAGPTARPVVSPP